MCFDVYACVLLSAQTLLFFFYFWGADSDEVLLRFHVEIIQFITYFISHNRRLQPNESAATQHNTSQFSSLFLFFSLGAAVMRIRKDFMCTTLLPYENRTSICIHKSCSSASQPNYFLLHNNTHNSNSITTTTVAAAAAEQHHQQQRHRRKKKKKNSK